MSEFEKKIEFSPAYDLRHKDAKKDYGVGAVTVRFYLIGEKGTIQFVFNTNVYPIHVQEERQREGKGPFFSNYIPMYGYDIGYHSPKPMYENQTPIAENHECEYSKGEKCYYDGSSLQAEEIAKEFIEKGTDWLWDKMKEYYDYKFKNK